MRRLPILLGLLVAVGFVLLSSIYTVDEREKAMVLQFGQVRDIHLENCPEPELYQLSAPRNGESSADAA